MTRSPVPLAVLLIAAVAPAQSPDPLSAKAVAVQADFAKNTVTVSGEWADLPAAPTVLTGDRGPLPKSVTATRTKTGLAVSGPTADVLGLLVPGTRSLAVAVADGPALRADLPAPQVGQAERVKEEKEVEGSVVITVPVSGAMPGVTLRVAEWPSTESRPRPALVLSHGSTAPIALADPAPGGDPPAFRVRLPAREETAGPLDLVFQAHNPDGSISPAVEITLLGNTPGKATRVVKDGLPAAVAQWAEAPACVLLSAEKAADACKQAGLVPVFYDAADGRELLLKELPDEAVAAQGVEPGTRVLKGSPLLLAFRPPQTVALPAAYAHAPGIEVDAPFGLVPVRRGGLLGLPASDRPARRPTQEKEDEPNEDPRVQLAPPGVSLDPTRSAADDGFTAAVQQVIAGARGSAADNPLAAAVRAGVEGGEGKVLAVLKEAKGADAMPAEVVLDAVADKLGVKLSDPDRSAALEAWKAEAGRMPVYALDANRDGRIADDIAVRLIHLLWQQGKYDPATHFQVVAANGGGVAVLPPKPVDPNWKKAAPTIQVENGETKPVRIPKGPAAASGSSTPSAVRVPAVSPDEMVKDYIAKLRAVGLKWKKEQETVQAGDPVAAVAPGERKWVPVGSAVTVAVHRRTPNVVGKTFADAEKLLGKIDLRVRPTVAKLTPAADDEIVEQQPREGETSPANGVVYVRCKRQVPDVVGKPAADAVAKLKGEWFDPEVIDRLALHDTIIAQHPAGGEAAPLNSQVILVVRRPIPDVTGLRFPDAVVKLREHGWRVANPADFKGLADGWVLEQGIAGGKIAKLLPDFDLDKLQLKLTPGVKVPGDLIGRTPAAAEQVLREAGLKAKYTKPDTAFWRVDAADPAVGKLVAVGSEVTLTLKDIGKKVPRVVGLPAAEAEADLTSHGVTFEWAAKPKAGEVVYSQDVKEGGVIDPAQAVKLTPGYRVPALQQLSVADARTAVEAVGGDLPATGVKERTVSTEVQADDGKTEVEGQKPEAGTLAERGAAVGVTAVRYAFKDPRLVVPKFVGMTEGEADRAADGQFELSKDWQEEQTADPTLAGKTLVTRQSPDAGGRLARLGVVTLTFTTYTAPPAPAKVKVPDYKGMTADEATAAEGRVDVRFAHGKAVIDANKAGRTEVTFQDLRAGAEVAEGTTVTLTLTRFVGRNDPPRPPPPEPVEKVRVPDVSGWGVSDAKAILAKAGFKTAVGAATAGPPPGNDPRKAGKTVVSSTSPAAFTAQPVGATVEVNTVTYTEVKPPPASKELVCYGTGWAVSPTRGSSVLPSKLTLSADRKSVTMTAMVGTLKGDVLNSPDALKAKKPVWEYKQVEMTGTLMKDGTGNGLLAYQFDKYLAFQIPADGEGEGAWVKSQAWSKTSQDGKTVYFTSRPSK